MHTPQQLPRARHVEGTLRALCNMARRLHCAWCIVDRQVAWRVLFLDAACVFNKKPRRCASPRNNRPMGAGTVAVVRMMLVRMEHGAGIVSVAFQFSKKRKSTGSGIGSGGVLLYNTTTPDTRRAGAPNPHFVV